MLKNAAVMPKASFTAPPRIGPALNPAHMEAFKSPITKPSRPGGVISPA